MNAHFLMLIWLVIYFILIFVLDKKYQLLRDTSTANKKPYSLSRVQLAWWMGFVLCAFVAIVFDKNNPNFSIPTFSQGILVVLGISAGTTAIATVTDVSDQTNSSLTRHQNSEGENLVLDILSDKDGPSVQRLQTVLFNVIFAVWFFLKVWKGLDCFDDIVTKNATSMQACQDYILAIKNSFDAIIPDLDQNALILLGLSSGTYAALKTTENKTDQPVG